MDLPRGRVRTGARATSNGRSRDCPAVWALVRPGQPRWCCPSRPSDRARELVGSSLTVQGIFLARGEIRGSIAWLNSAQHVASFAECNGRLFQRSRKDSSETFNCRAVLMRGKPELLVPRALSPFSLSIGALGRAGLWKDGVLAAPPAEFGMLPVGDVVFYEANRSGV